MSRRQWNHGRHTGYREGFNAGHQAGHRAGVLRTLKAGGFLALALLRSLGGRRTT